MGLWESFLANMGDALKAGLRNMGDTGETLREFRSRRSDRLEREYLLGQQATIATVVNARAEEALRAVAAERAKGHNVKVDPSYSYGFVLGEFQAILRFNAGGEKERVDVFYGGDSTPDGPNHGHMIFRKGKMDAWLAHGASGKARIKIV